MGESDKGEEARQSKSFPAPLLRPHGSEFLPDVVLSVCQILCFPFALDVDADLLVGVLADLRDSEVAAHLLQVHGKLPRHESGRGRWPATSCTRIHFLTAPGFSMGPAREEHLA